jgi:hypothetical protein
MSILKQRNDKICEPEEAVIDMSLFMITSLRHTRGRARHKNWQQEEMLKYGQQTVMSVYNL